MSNAARYIALGLLCASVFTGAYKGYVRLQETNRRSEHFRHVSNWLNAVVYGFKLNPINRHWSVEDGATFGNSWRLYYTLTFPFGDADAERGDGNQPWQAESLNYWDNSVSYLFCARNVREIPRDQRFANLMAIRGLGSAFDFMDEYGLDELRKVAPDAILLSEVANSQTPWMQSGDLELDKLPHAINTKNKMGIGSSRGYDQFGVGFADGEVWFLKTSIPFEELARFLTVESAREYDRQEVLGQYRVPYDEPDDR